MERLLDPSSLPEEDATTEVIVVGAGAAGLTAAVALAGAGVPTMLIGPRRPDPRTSALMVSSVAALETLGAWQHCASLSAPLKSLRIVDDTGRLLRAPQAFFEAAEVGLDAFAWNVRNDDLIAALRRRAAEIQVLSFVDAAAESIHFGDDAVAVTHSGGRTVRARLLVAADGRASPCREAAGISMNRRDLDQTALTLNLSIGRSHDWISTEFHTANGPFTLVPLPGRNASLVWVTRGDEAARLLELPADRLALEVERRSHSILGKISVDGARGAFRLVHETATDFAAHRLMLVGESGHVLPPIGAQGLNLGLRDAAMAAQLALDARRDGVDVGSDAVTALYRNARRIDIATRGLAVDVLNRSLLTGFLPVQAARGLALDLMERIAPLRRVVMREGVRPAFSTPRLMEGQPL